MRHRRSGVSVRDDEWESVDIPVAELSDERKPRTDARPPGPRSRRLAATALAVAVVGAGVVVVSHQTRHADAHRPAPEPGIAVRNVDDGRARVDVFSALRVTTGSGSFAIHYRLSETPAPASNNTTTTGSCGDTSNGYSGSTASGITVDCGYGMTSPHNVTISGSGAVIVDPTTMVTMANVDRKSVV